MDEEELKANYEALHEQTGESYESIAARVEEHGSKDLAAWLRSKADGGDGKTRAEAPKERSTGKGSVAAAETKAE